MQFQEMHCKYLETINVCFNVVYKHYRIIVLPHIWAVPCKIFLRQQKCCCNYQLLAYTIMAEIIPYNNSAETGSICHIQAPHYLN